MATEELKDIVEKLKKQGKMNFFDGASQEQIIKFEEDNNVKLPSKYKEWLLYSDGGEFFLPAGVQMYGVTKKPLIKIDDSDRPSDKYIVIGALASGDPILCEKNSEKISIYNHSAERIEDDEIYDDFISFLKDLHNCLG